MEDLPDHGHRHDYGGNPGEDGPSNEIGAEDGAMPHRLDGHGEDEGYHCMDGDHDRNDENGHKWDGLVEQVTLSLRSPVTQGEDLIKPFSFLAKIPQKRNVWNQSEIKADGTDREVGGNTYDIPQQGRSEMGIPNDV